MALKIKIPGPAQQHPWASLVVRTLLLAVVAVVLVFIAVGGYLYFKYQHIVDERLKQPIFASTAKIYAAPREVRPGQKFTVRLIANELREAGYSADGAAQTSPLGTYSQGAQTIAIHPGPQSYHSQDGATIHIEAGAVDAITELVASKFNEEGT